MAAGKGARARGHRTIGYDVCGLEAQAEGLMFAIDGGMFTANEPWPLLRSGQYFNLQTVR